MENKIINIKPKFYGNNFYLTIEGINDKNSQSPFEYRKHDFWKKKLLKDNLEAKCDISGETDKRFLVLHHLHNKADGGLNNETNYVILSNNYHLAFHSWNGGYRTKCTKEYYELFKKEELEILKNNKNGI